MSHEQRQVSVASQKALPPLKAANCWPCDQNNTHKHITRTWRRRDLSTREQGYLVLRGRGLLTVHDIQYTRDQQNTLTHSHTLVSTSRGSSHLVLLVSLVFLVFLAPL